VFMPDRGLVKPYRYVAHWQLCLAEEDWRRVTTRYGLPRSRRSRTRLPWGSRKSTTTTYDSDGLCSASEPRKTGSTPLCCIRIFRELAGEHLMWKADSVVSYQRGLTPRCSSKGPIIRRYRAPAALT
jgi:hypothetical protein